MIKSISVLLLTGIFLMSCGDKENTETQIKDTNITTPQQTELPPADTVKNTISTDTAGASAKLEAEMKSKEAEAKKKQEEEKKKKEEEAKKKKEDEQKKEELTTKNEKVSASDFSAIWKKRCVKCHGANGKGKVEGVPDLTKSTTQNKSNKELYDIIANGVKGETEDDEDMPSFKNRLSKEEIEAAIRHVKGL